MTDFYLFLFAAVVFVGMQVWDVTSTNHFLTVPGWYEANPLGRWAQARFGRGWWIIKLPELLVPALLYFMATHTWLGADFRYAAMILGVLDAIYFLNNIRNQQAF